MNKKGIGAKTFKIIGAVLATPMIIMLLAIVLLYIPSIQRYAIEKIGRIVAEESGYNLNIGTFRLHFPLSFSINNYTLTEKSDTLLQGRELRANINPLPLLKGEIEVNYIYIDSTTIDSHRLVDGLRIKGHIGHFRTSIRNIELADNKINVSRLHLTDSDILLTQTTAEEEKDTTAASPAATIINLKKGNISNVKFEMNIPEDTTHIYAYLGKTELQNAKIDLGESSYTLDKFTMAGSAAQYDRGTEPDSISPANHLKFDNIAVEIEKLAYTHENIGAHLSTLSLRQQPTGIAIKESNLTINGDTSIIAIEQLNIESYNGTTLQAHATLPREILYNINTHDKGNATLAVQLNKRDLEGFLDRSTYNTMRELPDSMLYLSAILHGNTHNLNIDTLYARLNKIAEAEVSGTGKDLADSRKRTFDITLTGKTYKLQSTNNKQNTPLLIKGTASLYQGEYTTNTTITYNEGKTTAQVSYSTNDNSYEANIEIANFSTSQLLPEIPLHTLSMTATLNGRGTDLYNDSTQYHITAQIDTINYDNKKLSNITLQATQKQGTSQIHLKSEAEALFMELWAETLLANNTIANKTKIDAAKINLQQLGITTEPFETSMQLNAKLQTDLDETYNLAAVGNDIHMKFNGKRHKADSLNIAAATKSDSTAVRLTSGDLDIEGNIATGYKAIIESIEKVKKLAISKYTANDTVIDITEYERLLPQASFKVNSGNKNLISEYLEANGITYTSVNLYGTLDTIKGLHSRGYIHNLEHNNQHLDTLRIALAQDSTQLKYIAGVRSRAIGDNDEKASFGAVIYGTLDKEKLITNYIFRDKNDVVGMKIGATTRLQSNGISISFAPHATLFKQPFTFNKENYISLDREMNIRGNIEMLDTITYSGMNLYATSDTLHKRDISLELFNIDLQTATKMLPYAPNMSGIINADMHYREDAQGTIISSDIRSDSLTYEGTLIGNETLEFSYFPKNSNEHHAYLTLLHNNTDIAKLEGIYNSDSLNRKNRGELMLKKFPLEIANAFLQQTGATTGGYIDGEIAIDNRGKHPIANGYISFDSAYTDLPQFGTTLHLVDDKIELNNNILKIEDFDIYAKGNTPFKTNGTIDLNNLSDPDFNLKMQASNYEIINAKRNKGAILYGRMFLDLNSRIRGKLSALKVNGTATILGKSDVTYVLQETPLETGNTLDGLVTFTNFNDTTTITPEIPDYNLGNINMNITLGIEEGARINADFDTERTSYVELQGEGNLNLTYTYEAGMNLTGRYRLSNGQMKYSLPIIPLKTFKIKEGSSINWNGDILNPTLDITAVEHVITSVIIDDNNQAVGFDVGVKLSNTLDDMGLNFTLSAPDNAAVQNQLNSVDAETLNKYALTMLITGAYIGGGNSLTVSSALSSFLDAQINNLVAGAMNSTVDINVGITDLEDATTGDTYKNYSFSFTKRFWNDRLKVIIGGEVNDNANANTNESFINNVSLEWKISNSGNRYLRLFYDKNYESILEGEITETGIGYVYKRKLNNLNELLIFRKKKKQQTVK